MLSDAFANRKWVKILNEQGGLKRLLRLRAGSVDLRVKVVH